ncbi:hypothetical protein L4D00_02575 [Photobacterium swingsii]|uniref:hypothetical protein n=1 Tax=Photobacterium swingsii TaxID=680026 RepID=UPI003D14F88B
MSASLPIIISDDLEKLSETLSTNIHKDFYCVDYISKGLLYIHGKMPDLIKEFLEYKFSSLNDIKYLVANSVILEGVNLPVDNLYILHTRGMETKALHNLIGRVNRLNEVFDNNRKNLNKLLPPIHFVNSLEFNPNSKMESKIKLLRSGISKDTIENPLLYKFNSEKLKNELSKTSDPVKQIELDKKIDKISKLKAREDFLANEDGNPENKIDRILLASSLHLLYYNYDDAIEKLKEKIDIISSTEIWNSSDILEKIYIFFISDLEEYITNAEFSRLKYESARNFYRNFIDKTHKLTLSQHIYETVAYYQRIKGNTSGKAYFVGTSYGELSKENSHNVAYIDLSTKSDKELVNIALVKIKIESDFVSYTINQYVNVLYDLDLINDDEYNLHMYGTTNKRNSEFVKLGFSGSLLKRLEQDGQLEHLSINMYGIVEFSGEFRQYFNSQDELTQFEIRKFIDL